MVNRCEFRQCPNRVAVIIGHCKACQGKWCLNHRLPESHLCTHMETIRQESFDRNMNKLMEEKTCNKKV